MPSGAPALLGLEDDAERVWLGQLVAERGSKAP
jgi:hypothetical protein